MRLGGARYDQAEQAHPDTANSDTHRPHTRTAQGGWSDRRGRSWQVEVEDFGDYMISNSESVKIGAGFFRRLDERCANFGADRIAVTPQEFHVSG